MLCQTVKLIEEHGAVMGKIYELKEIVHGKEKKQRQTAAAVFDEEEKVLKFDTAGIRNTTVKHIKETLQDLKPESRFEKLVENRKKIIDGACDEEMEERIEFRREELKKVVWKMAEKGKECHKPLTKASDELKEAILVTLN